jgi:hypothetical protein
LTGRKVGPALLLVFIEAAEERFKFGFGGIEKVT